MRDNMSIPANYNDFFQAAAGENFLPYPYQSRLATLPWPDVIKIPTGLGKTAAIILAWLYKHHNSDPDTPRRLVYCLPMRVLVEQTATCTSTWIDKLCQAGFYPDPEKIPAVHLLMGGNSKNDWDPHPEKPAILVGTQDQLLSRALNRGYATSRYRWPVQFGLLHNDALWVMDEVQLMGVGLATTVQLEAFRRRFGVMKPSRSIWMSATIKRDWLTTVDFRVDKIRELSLSEDDLNLPAVQQRNKAHKQVAKAESGSKPGELGGFILKKHRRGGRTLVVVNTVKRAAELYQALEKIAEKSGVPVMLIHSRFRPPERRQVLDRLLEDPPENGIICISTQVIEAGVDISANTLVTELAPWASLVQRFGRCNRNGTDQDARIFWVPLDTTKEKDCLPYTPLELAGALEIISRVDNGAPGELPGIESNYLPPQVIRHTDLLDLFDTTSDISGFDIDISRFIRETNDHDVQVFWRDFSADNHPPHEAPRPQRHELCPVPVADLHDLLKAKGANPRRGWLWDVIEKKWLPSSRFIPGQMVMLPTAAGGYLPEVGWTGKIKDRPEALSLENTTPPEANDTDPYTTGNSWQTLSEHTSRMVRQLRIFIQHGLVPAEEIHDDLLTGGRWHDTGKAHPVFQQALVAEKQPPANEMWAKTAGRNVTYQRRGFRHELASALALLQNGGSDLSVYLAAAHHGKVRLSIQSLPGETPPVDPEIRFARGIYDGDILPGVSLGDEFQLPETTLDMEIMEAGEGRLGPSWSARMLDLLYDPQLGPFRLAYLEALIRTADWLASSGEVGPDMGRTEGKNHA